jgi:hypothetical protein
MVEMTAVPLPPHPMTPILMAELALLPNAIAGLTIVKAEMAAVLLINFLRLRCVIMLGLKFTPKDCGPAGPDPVCINVRKWTGKYIKSVRLRIPQ